MLDKMNISCDFVESTNPVICVEIARNSLINEQTVLITYDADLMEERYITLTYSNQFCEVYKELNITGKVNTSVTSVIELTRVYANS